MQKALFSLLYIDQNILLLQISLGGRTSQVLLFRYSSVMTPIVVLGFVSFSLATVIYPFSCFCFLALLSQKRYSIIRDYINSDQNTNVKIKINDVFWVLFFREKNVSSEAPPRLGFIVVFRIRL